MSTAETSLQLSQHTFARVNSANNEVIGLDFYGGQIVVGGNNTARDTRPLDMGILALSAAGERPIDILEIYNPSNDPERLREPVIEVFKRLKLTDERVAASKVANAFRMGVLIVEQTIDMPHPAAAKADVLPEKLIRILRGIARNETDARIARNTQISESVIKRALAIYKEMYDLKNEAAAFTFALTSGHLEINSGAFSPTSRKPALNQHATPLHTLLAPKPYAKRTQVDRRIRLSTYTQEENASKSTLVQWNGGSFEFDFSRLPLKQKEILIKTLVGCSGKSIINSGITRSHQAIQRQLAAAKRCMGVTSESDNLGPFIKMAIEQGSITVYKPTSIVRNSALSLFEQQIIQLLAKGKSRKEIVNEVSCPEGSVKKVIHSLYAAFNTNTPDALLLAAYSNGLLKTRESKSE